MRKRTTRRRRSATPVKARRRARRSFARAGFIDRDLLMNVGGVTAGLFLPELLLSKLRASVAEQKVANPNQKPALEPLVTGWGAIAAQAAMGLAAAYFLRKYQPKLAVMFGVGACSGAALRAISQVQLAANSNTQNTMVGYEPSYGEGVAGYIESTEQPAMAGYIGSSQYAGAY